MRTPIRVLALAAVSVLALTGCIRVEMNVTLQENDTASGDFVFAVSQELLEVVGEESIDDLVASEQSIPGAVSERYESEDSNDEGEPNFVGSRTTFTDLPLDDFDAAGDGLRIARDGDDYVVSGVTDDLTEQAGGEDLPDDATATMSITFPGKVATHNGVLDGNTVTWDLLTHTGEVEARGSATPDGGFPLWVILVLLAVVGIGVGIAAVLITSTRRKTVDESHVIPGSDMDPAFDARDGDPIDAPPYPAAATDGAASAGEATEGGYATEPAPAVNGIPAGASAEPDAAAPQNAEPEFIEPEPVDPQPTDLDGPDEENPRP